MKVKYEREDNTKRSLRAYVSRGKHIFLKDKRHWLKPKLANSIEKYLIRSINEEKLKSKFEIWQHALYIKSQMIELQYQHLMAL